MTEPREADAVTAQIYESTLPDATRVVYRPVRPDDKQRFRSGLEQLSPRSRYLRFFQSIDHFTDDQLRYLTEVDFVDHFAWVAIADDAGIGSSRWIRLRENPAVAEAAVTVVDAYQRRGIGTTLLYLAARSAIERGVRAFRAYALGDNQTILDLLLRLGGQPGQWEAGVLEVMVPLPEDPADLPTSPAPLILRGKAAGHRRSDADGALGR